MAIYEAIMVMEAQVVVFSVVEEVAAIPVTAPEADSKVSKAVVNPAIVTDGAPPVAGIPAVSAVDERPVSRCPKSSLIWRLDPSSVDPVVAIVVVGPVSWGPNISIGRRYRLHIDGDCWWSYTDRDEDSCAGGGRCEQ